MTFMVGCKLISFQEMVQTRCGLYQWNELMTQVQKISLQYPLHFFSETAKIIIPKDAERHLFFAYFSNDKTIASFCIVTVYGDQAEYIWAASDKEYKGRMPVLYHFIECYLSTNEPQVCKIVAMCVTDDSRCVNGTELIDGSQSSWARTRLYHERMGFNFSYKLEDYWGEGSHANVYIKRKGAKLYGYTNIPDIKTDSTEKSNECDSFPEINGEIQEQIRSYLDVFDEEFTNAPSTIRDSGGFKLLADGRLKGFTGLALINEPNKKATMFCQTTTELIENENKKLVERFEYNTESSALTRLFVEYTSNNSDGIFFYDPSWDNESVLKLKFFFNKFYPNLDVSNGFTVFCSRKEGEDDHYAVLYFVMPRVENVVSYKLFWRSFSHYSFALIIESYSYMESLRILNPRLEDNKYLLDLIQCVSPGDSSETGDISQFKVIQMRKSIQARINDHHQAISHSKEIAFRNTGHLMRNRCEAIRQHLKLATGQSLLTLRDAMKGNPIDNTLLCPRANNMYFAMQSAQNLSDYFQSLQLWGFNSLDAVWNEYVEYPEKLWRYFIKSNEPLNIGKFVKEEALSMLEERHINGLGNRIVTLHIDDSSRHVFYLNPVKLFENSLSCFHLSKSVLSTVFFEIFLNAVRHGMINNEENELRSGYASVSLGFGADYIDNTPVLTIFNDAFLPTQEAREKYNDVSRGFKKAGQYSGRGLDLIARGLSELGLGNIWVRRFSNEHGDFYEAAIGLKGLSWSESE